MKKGSKTFCYFSIMNSQTKFGVDVIIDNANNYKGLKIALLCNQVSVTANGIHSRLALQQSGLSLVKLFAPEHGFDTKGVDGAFINHQIDELTGLPIVSLYSNKLMPSEEDLSDVDIVLVDLPDIGSRFYTYLWTMSYILESCEKYNKRVIILDRPNPMAHNIDLAEGPILNEQCASFIGRFPIPVTHQCTFGELARYFKATIYPNTHLEVIKMENWDRLSNCGYSFFPTSPAIQHRETTYTYAGACLFEGLNINEGRGSEYPFSQFGAPWIDAEILYQEIKKQKIGNAQVQIVKYTPSISLYAEQVCHGLRIIPNQPSTFQSFSYFLKVIKIINKLFPNKLQERNYYTNVNPEGKNHLDLLIGIPNVFDLLKEGNINSKLEDKDWKNIISPYLLY